MILAYTDTKMELVFCMKSLELTSAVTALANAIACNLTVDEISLIASIFVQLGDTLATIAARENLCGNPNKNEG